MQIYQISGHAKSLQLSPNSRKPAEFGVSSSETRPGDDKGDDSLRGRVHQNMIAEKMVTAPVVGSLLSAHEMFQT